MISLLLNIIFVFSRVLILTFIAIELVEFLAIHLGGYDKD